METREKSVAWWDSLSEPTKKYLSEQYILGRSYVTYSDIDKMFLEITLKNVIF